jgi:glutathione peroxidase
MIIKRLFDIGINLATTAFSFGYHLLVKGADTIMKPTHNMAQDTVIHPFPNFDLKTLDGRTLHTQDFKGKKIIILNVASECGYTPQYSDWQKFYDANKEDAVVLGFPCNDFGGQEPGGANEIQNFCQKNYGVTFPILEKINVSGDDQSPVYQWLSSPDKNGWNDAEPSWNFCKYLIDEDGKLVRFFGSNVKPNHPSFLEALGL